MIYLSKNNETKVITDNVTNFSPENIDVYLDEILIGNFENLSTNDRELKFITPKLELTEREYVMKIYSSNTLIKEELIIVKDLTKFEPISINKAKKIKMYEK